MQCSMFPTGRNMEHCFLYARQTRLAVSSPLLSPCVYIHIGMDHYPQCASHKAGMWVLHPSVNAHAERMKKPACQSGRPVKR